MAIASLRETVNFSNKTDAVSPFNLGQVLASFATKTYVTDAIAHAVIDPSQIDLSAYAKRTDLPTKLSQLLNDANYVQTVSGKIPSEYLPAYVDDVLEVNTYSALPQPGESGKIYVTLDDNLTYRWAGSDYVEISKSLALGETSATAYRGDRGKIAYDHSQATGNPHGLSLSDLGVLVSATEINYLSGLNKNIMTLLNKKLNMSGGTMTGSLILYGAPTKALEAATKDYVDTAINGISVTVTQNVTNIQELQQTAEGITETLTTHASTLTDVQNDITGLNQTTTDNTTAITTLETRAGTVERTLTEQHETITTLKGSVDILNLVLSKYNVVIPVDANNKPLTTAADETAIEVKFAGAIAEEATITASGSNTGLACTISNGKVYIGYDALTAIPNSSNTFTITATLVSGGVTYTNSKNIIVTTVPKGSDGESGISITAITEWYYKSDSRTELSGGTWVTTSPTSEDGKYIWTKTVFTFSNSTTTATNPVCVTGDAGVIGHDGTTITGVDVLYYQSNSSSTLSGGSWSTTAPTWVSGKYLWTKNRISYKDYNNVTWSEDSEPVCVTGQKGEDNYIISDTAPSDTSQLWFNTVDSFMYYYDSDTLTWEKISDFTSQLSDLGDRITDNDSKAQGYAQAAQNEIYQTVYTKTETENKIRETAGQMSETFTRTITEATANGNNAYNSVIQLEANITRGMDDFGNPFILLQTGNKAGFSLKIANDKISIMQGEMEVSGWTSDKFDVATVITNSLGLGDFEFVIKPGAVGSRGLSFKHRE